MSDDVHSSVGGFPELPSVDRSMFLLEAAKRGDGEALNELLERYQDRVARIVRIRLYDKWRPYIQDEDIVQGAFIRAVNALPKVEIQEHAQIINWITTLVRNEIVDQVRRLETEKRDVAREVPIDRDVGVDPASLKGVTRTPSSVVRHEEFRVLFDQAVQELASEDQREVVFLRDYMHASWDFVMEEMGRKTVVAVRSLYDRAWLKLEARLGSYFADEGPADSGSDPRTDQGD